MSARTHTDCRAPGAPRGRTQTAVAGRAHTDGRRRTLRARAAPWPAAAAPGTAGSRNAWWAAGRVTRGNDRHLNAARGDAVSISPGGRERSTPHLVGAS